MVRVIMATSGVIVLMRLMSYESGTTRSDLRSSSRYTVTSVTTFICVWGFRGDR